jgi:predicted kinase
MRPTAHLITGLPCSGKTTYAMSLAEASGGVLFSLDYWFITLHGRYSLDELLRRGVDVVLDDGFFFREHRVQQIAAFQQGGARVIRTCRRIIFRFGRRRWNDSSNRMRSHRMMKARTW